MSQLIDSKRATWGITGFSIGVFALLAAMLLVSGMFVEQDQSVGVSIGQIARDIRDAATGALTDTTPPSPEPRRFDANEWLSIVTPVLAALAAILGGISLYRHEPTALPKLAIGLGITAFVMQYAFWLALLACGTVLLVSIVSNLGGILGE